MTRLVAITAICFFWAFLSPASPAYASSGKSDGVIAKVGDQEIYFSEIDRMINSSSMIGVSLPPAGTPARNTLRLTVLDKVISANLLYLDALKQGLDKNTVFMHDVTRFSDAMLAAIYKEKYLIGDIRISDDEVLDYFHNNIKPGTVFDRNVGAAIRATLRKEKFSEQVATLRNRLRKGVHVVIEESLLRPEQGSVNKPSDVVARVGDETLAWGDIERSLLSSHTPDARLKVVNRLVDTRIMISKARASGLEKDPVYLARVQEFRKARLINLRRAELDRVFEPDEQALSRYFRDNQDRITIRARRKVQMVVVKTEEEARHIRKQIESGEITMYQAAQQYSIAPDARKTLGELGWVTQGRGFPSLDELAFSLPVDKLGGPVKSPAGWHLVKVLAVRDAAFTDIHDKSTRQRTRQMYLRKRQQEYVVGLRKHDFPVKVFDDVINRILQAEVNAASSTKSGVSDAEHGGSLQSGAGELSAALAG